MNTLSQFSDFHRTSRMSSHAFFFLSGVTSVMKAYAFNAKKNCEFSHNRVSISLADR